MKRIALLLLSSAALASALDLPGSLRDPAPFGTAWGVDPAGFANRFERAGDLSVVMTASSIPTNILHPGEGLTCTLRLQQPAGTTAQREVDLILVAYEFRTPGEDYFQVEPIGLGEVDRQRVRLEFAADGIQTMSFTPKVPDRFGGYALLMEIPGGARALVGGITRVIKNAPVTDPNQRLTIDLHHVPTCQRLGVTTNRLGGSPRTPAMADRDGYYAKKRSELDTFAAAKLPIIFEFGHDCPLDGAMQPMGQRRPHLDADNKMLESHLFDGAWLPAADGEFRDMVRWILRDYGWPNGPVRAVKLWNEPWEGGSIAAWGADMPRFRELTDILLDEVRAARRDGIEVLIGGCDSSSNTFDKLFPDGDPKYLEALDFMSVHYQGLSPASTVRQWTGRTGAYGPVQVWDTESWFANSDERVSGIIPTMIAAGYSRIVAVQSEHAVVTMGQVDGVVVPQSWSVTAALAAVQNLVGNRPFDRVVRSGLPWVYRFTGTNAEDDTLVVVGDLAPLFGYDIPLHRTVRSLAELTTRADEFAALAALSVEDAKRPAAEAAWSKRQPYTGATLTINDPEGRFRLFDKHGNAIAAPQGQIVVPLDQRGFYLRGDGTPGAAAALLAAVQAAPARGIQPVDITVADPQGPDAPAQVTITNVLERNITGTVQCNGQRIALTLAAGATVTIPVALTIPANSNALALSLLVDAGADGIARHAEVMHVNRIAARAITVDGDLGEWAAVPPQRILASEGGPTTTEAAWWPGRAFPPSLNKGLATVRFAADDAGFHLAAEIADTTPHPGTLRFATRDDDAFFYPEKVIDHKGNALIWPADVRRYSYRCWPTLPCGSVPNLDNVQIAFNALPVAAKPWAASPPGTPVGFTDGWSTDYEFALNTVAQAYGGGTEVWTLRHPDLPMKHYYPRQPKAPGEGAVTTAKLSVRYVNGLRLVEATIPWSAIPAVQALRQRGEPVSVSVRINDDAGAGCMELARHRSVSRRTSNSFQPDWSEHWTNTVAFG